MTDPQLRIEVAKRLGWTHCEASFGRVVGYAPGNDGTPSDIPDYPGDPREWAVLLEAMGDAFSEVRREACHKSRFDRGFYFRVVLHPRIIQDDDGGCDLNCYDAPTLGRAVCLAWIAWHDATGGEGE